MIIKINLSLLSFQPRFLNFNERSFSSETKRNEKIRERIIIVYELVRNKDML